VIKTTPKVKSTEKVLFSNQKAFFRPKTIVILAIDKHIEKW
jgi:hypothetical protein